MAHTNNLFILILTLCFTTISCEHKVADTKEEKRVRKNAEKEINKLQKIIEELKQERQQIIELNEQSLKEIKNYESKRLAAERAEQIRIRTDELELQALFDNKLKKIKLNQKFQWDGYIDKQYAQLPTTDGKTYTGVTVLSVDATGLSLQHQNGVSRIPFSLISAEMQKQNITAFEKQVQDLKKWFEIETQERKYIRENAKAEAQKEFE